MPISNAPSTSLSPLAESLDINAERMNQLKALFPEVFTEGKMDVKRLARALGTQVHYKLAVKAEDIV